MNKSKKKGGGKMIRSKQRKRRNSLNFGEMKDVKRVVITKTRYQIKAGNAFKAVVVFVSVLQALSNIVEAITKIIKSFISQCIAKSLCDFYYRFLIGGSIC